MLVKGALPSQAEPATIGRIQHGTPNSFGVAIEGLGRFVTGTGENSLGLLSM